MWIIWYTYVVNDASLLQSNPVSNRASDLTGLFLSRLPAQSAD